MTTMAMSTRYWTYEHLQCMLQFKLGEALGRLFHLIHSTNDRNKLKNVLELISCFTSRAYHISQKDDPILFIDWMTHINKYLFKQHCMSCNLYNSSRNKCKYFHIMVGKFHANLDQIKQGHHLKFDSLTEISKKCGNHECKIKKYGMKMKICKECKMVYYCGRRCQKKHWKSIHRVQCDKINVNLNKKYIKSKEYDVMEFVFD